jgi:hypothetical protein
MFVVRPMKYMGRQARMTEMGMVRIGMRAEGMCHRNSKLTTLTRRLSTISSCLRVSIERSISTERS